MTFLQRTWCFFILTGSFLGFSESAVYACDFTPSENVIILPSGTHNMDAAYTQVYLLADADGIIQATSSSGDFGPQPYGKYFAYALNYETANPPVPLPANGVDVSAISGGCMNLSAPTTAITVCATSVLEACENSGEVITLISAPDHTMNAGFNQIIVLVNDATGNIVIQRAISASGSATFTTETGTGELSNGDYTAYAVNYEDPETPASLGIIAGNPWTGSFGSACAAASAGAAVTVYAPGLCTGGTSVLSACENSGEVISIHVSGYNAAVGFSEAIVIVDSVTQRIAAVKDLGASDISIFTTETGTGDLNEGIYQVYALNYESPATLASLGAIIGNSWPIAIGGACADTTPSVPAIVTAPGSCVLPIEIMQFSGSGHANYNLLTWEFLLDNGTVDLVHHHPTSGLTQTLSPHLDPSDSYFHYAPPAGQNVYRLRMTNLNGSVTLSQPVVLENTADFGFSIAGNPVKDGPIELVLSGNPIEKAQLRIVDMVGRVLLEKYIFPDGEPVVEIAPAGSLSKGIYLIEVAVQGARLPVQRLIIE